MTKAKDNKPSIVLVRPQLPENIGMVARAMDNFGLKNLILVNPREIWPNDIAIQSSANSKEIILRISLSNFAKS
jgi:tRNA/rRNA methyltransferase